MELSLPVITTYICCDRESNTQPSACEVRAQADCATATTAFVEFQATIVICYIWVLLFVIFCVTEESAMTEPAWEGAGTEVGLKIWRIVVSGTPQNQSPS